MSSGGGSGGGSSSGSRKESELQGTTVTTSTKYLQYAAPVV